jgi:hypothetical protein
MSVDSLLERLAAVERRLAEHAGRELPSGLTDPDPGADERWEAGQVWAHLAEFPGYWLDQVEGVLDAQRRGASQPISFGRTKTDAGRIGAIEQDRHHDPATLLGRVRAGLIAARRFLLHADQQQLTVRGLHATLGEVTIEQIIEHFLASHLEEHAEQLDRLAGPPPAEEEG